MKAISKRLLSLTAAAALFCAVLPAGNVYAANASWSASGDVEAGTELMPGLSPMISLTYKGESKSFDDGSTFDGYITHSETNGGWNGTDMTATGDALEYNASRSGDLTVYISDLKGKSAYIVEKGATSDKKALASVALTYYAETTGTSTNVILTAHVEKGHTYYAFVDGSKGRYCGAAFIDDGTTPDDGGDEGDEYSEDLEAAQADADALEIGSISRSAVYFDVVLPKTGANASKITWESSNPEYIDVRMVSNIERCYTGVVKRPSEEECEDGYGVDVTLTATIKNGTASVTKEFPVSVRKWNPNVYWNDFEADVNQPAEGDFHAIEDDVVSNTGETFRGIKVDTLKESRAFVDFNHNDVDTPVYFDKRVMYIDENKYNGKPEGSDEGDNYAFYYREYNAYGGASTIPMWITLTDRDTGSAPEGIVIMQMDIYVIDADNQFQLGLANSKPSQMCRFMLGKDPKGGYLRCFSNEASVDFMGGKDGYRVPVGKWCKAIIVANADSHKWDFYFDGMQIGSGFDFRNAEDYVSTIEFVMNRSYDGGAYLIDNILVENITGDFVNVYWDELGINTLAYDEESEAYMAEKPFLLQYQGTGSMGGNYFSWQSDNTDALRIETIRMPIEELADFGYTQEQIKDLADKGIPDVSVIKAIPGDVYEDTAVTLTAKLQVGETLHKKQFSVVVKSNKELPTEEPVAETPTPRPTTRPSSGGGGGGGGGGGVATANNVKPLTTPTPAPNVTPAPTPRPADIPRFDDLNEAKWAEDAILYLYSKDVVDGYGNDIFGVNDDVTREQFLKMLINALNLKLYKNEDSSFADVAEGSWYEVYVESALRHGITNGISDTEFGVGQNITRQDMAVMCVRAMKLIDSDKAEFEDTEEIPEISADQTEISELTDEEKLIEKLSFSDKADIADYAKLAVAVMADKDFLVSEDNGTYLPKKVATRAETAVVLYKVMKKYEG